MTFSCVFGVSYSARRVYCCNTSNEKLYVLLWAGSAVCSVRSISFVTTNIEFDRIVPIKLFCVLRHHVSKHLLISFGQKQTRLHILRYRTNLREVERKTRKKKNTKQKYSCKLKRETSLHVFWWSNLVELTLNSVIYLLFLLILFFCYYREKNEIISNYPLLRKSIVRKNTVLCQ